MKLFFWRKKVSELLPQVKPNSWFRIWNSRGGKNVEVAIAFKSGGYVVIGKLPNTPANVSVLNELCGTDHKYHEG